MLMIWRLRLGSVMRATTGEQSGAGTSGESCRKCHYSHIYKITAETMGRCASRDQFESPLAPNTYIKLKIISIFGSPD